MIAAAALTFATFTVTLGGRTVLPRTRTAVVGGRVLLPVRAVGRALDADVGYDAAARVITLQRGTRVAHLPASGAVRVVAGRAYAPLRALANAFGVGVAYDGATRTVALRDDGNVARNERMSTAGTGTAPGMSSAQATNGGPGAGNVPGTTGLSAAVVITGLQPADGAVVHEPYPAIAARIDGAAAIDRAGLRLLVDGRDVTADANVVGNAVLYTPRTALPPGDHAVALSANGLSRRVEVRRQLRVRDAAAGHVLRPDRRPGGRGDLLRPLRRPGHERVRRDRARRAGPGRRRRGRRRRNALPAAGGDDGRLRRARRPAAWRCTSRSRASRCASPCPVAKRARSSCRRRSPCRPPARPPRRARAERRARDRAPARDPHSRPGRPPAHGPRDARTDTHANRRAGGNPSAVGDAYAVHGDQSAVRCERAAGARAEHHADARREEARHPQAPPVADARTRLDYFSSCASWVSK